MKIDLSI